MNTGKIIAAALMILCLSIFWQVSFARAWGAEPNTITLHQFHDRNRNGLQDEQEDDLSSGLMRVYSEGSEGLQVIATNADDSVTTEVNLSPGSYKVWIELAECWLPTTPGVYWQGGYLVDAMVSTDEQTTVVFGQVFTCTEQPSQESPTSTPLSPDAPVLPSIGSNSGATEPTPINPVTDALGNMPMEVLVDTPTPTGTPTGTSTNTPTATPTGTPTGASTNTPTATPTGTPTNTPTATPTGTPTGTSTNTPTATPTSAATSTPTSTPTATPAPPPPSFEGCTSVYWKSNNHFDSWVGYQPTDLVKNVFDASDFLVDGKLDLDNNKKEDTLLDALKYNDKQTSKAGTVRILLREAVAALLNAANRTVDYPIEPVEALLIEVNAALTSKSLDTMRTEAIKLNGYNNADCPLN